MTNQTQKMSKSKPLYTILPSKWAFATIGVLCVAILLLMAKANTAAASVTLPADLPYFAYRTPGTQYIFTKRAQEFLHEFAAHHKALRSNYDQSFGWRLDETAHIILASERHQIPNAYATFIPFVQSVWFPAGSGYLESFAESSWLLTLNAHEVAHLYQLNAKGSFNSKAKSFLGNTPLTIFLGLPIFIHPNVFQPTFLIEGNAVFNESRFNMGGRLHSGEKRALVFAQALAGQINPNNLINIRLKFPYYDVPYLIGGYFFAHLARKYGVDKTNQFFVETGNHYFNPLRLNAAFRNHFGKSYPQEIREFVRNLELQAKDQMALNSPVLGFAEFFGGFNQDQNSIWYLLSNQVRNPQLIIFDKKSRKFQIERRDLEMGKVFFNEARKPQVATSSQPNLHSIEYSLYGEGLELNEKYRGQIVTEQRNGKTAALDATNGWKEPQLLIDGKFYDIAHSSAIFDELGSIYYFRQNGEDRILYKNREPVFKFRGFYGKPVEIGRNGEIYFIANTEKGSTLYQYFKNEISRVVDSDRITDARIASDKEFLVTEVTSRGYEVKLAELKKTSQVPAFYTYGFTSETLPAAAMVDPEQVKSEQVAYNGLKQMRYSALQLDSAYSGKKGLVGSSQFDFADPLQWHQLSLFAQRSSLPSNNYGLWYSYSRWLPNIVAGYEYSENTRFVNDERHGHYFANQHYLGIELPLLKWRRFESSIQELAKYQVDNEKIGSQETWGLVSRFNFLYNLQHSLAMWPSRRFELTYKNNLGAKADGFKKNQNTSFAQFSSTIGLPLEFYIRSELASAWAETRDIEVEMVPNQSISRTGIARLAGDEEFKVKSAQVFRLEAEKAFRVPAHSPRIPVGIMRIAPLVAGQVIAMDPTHIPKDSPTLYEFAAGADFDLLVMHKFMVRIRPLLGFDNLTEDQKFSATMMIRQEF